MAQMRAVLMPDRAVNMNAAVRVIDSGEEEMGGPRLPVYILTAADLKVNGGNFTLNGGKPIKMARSTVGKVLGGMCIPVYPVLADGSYDAGW